MDKPKTASKFGDNPKARARDLRAQQLANELRANLKRRKSGPRPPPDDAVLAENLEPEGGSDS